uniref:Uncharacterized protein n=1 Tax=Lepeophtheirus salmonis TaxID=72036 RepID=A0A0K2UL62_LEPSM
MNFEERRSPSEWFIVTSSRYKDRPWKIEWLISKMQCIIYAMTHNNQELPSRLHAYDVSQAIILN